MRMEVSSTNHNNHSSNIILNNNNSSNSHSSSSELLEKELKNLEICKNGGGGDDDVDNINIKNKNITKNGTSTPKIHQQQKQLINSGNTSLSTTPVAELIKKNSDEISSTSTIIINNDQSSSTSSLTTSTTTTTVTNKRRTSNNTSNSGVTPSLSTRTPTRKAKRVRFYRNGDRFYPGITIPVSNERYRSYESLAEDLTRLLEDNVKIPGAVRNIYTLNGKKISNLDELEDGQNYVCCCNKEGFKKIEYNIQQNQPQQQLQALSSSSTSAANGSNPSSKLNNLRLKVNRPSSPLKNGTNGISPISSKLNERDSVVYPRIVTLIRNGTKPRKIMRLLLNKRNSPSFDHVLQAITQVVKLDTGCVRKVYTLSGTPVLQLADFFIHDEDVFFAYGTERVNADDFKLEPDEAKAIRQLRKPLKNGLSTTIGSKPKMPLKTKNVHNVTYDNVDEESAAISGIHIQDLPHVIRDRYTMGQIIGDGNFAIVLKCKDKQTNNTYALKIIDKSKCKGKEHYIDAEVRVMKKLNHQHIISLILDVDQPNNMYLVLEYVGGGDLFDAITHVTRFSEDQSRTMIKHLASAMAYLHSMSIVHRDIKPENLLVELDNKGNVLVLKLADFGLACEVTEPLTAVCGTPTYVAPEILMETGYGLKIDVWAAGIILYILLCGFPPFVSPDNQQEPLFDAILSGIYEFPDPYWTEIGEGVRDLISNMLQSDPNLRFSSEDILDHYWTLGGETYEYS